jgi:hypothetical protein
MVAVSGTTTTTDRADRRRRRLREELADVGFVVPEGLDGELLLGEIDYARHPPRHEGMFPSYGALLCADAVPDLAPYDRYGTGATSVDTLRRLADGRQSFVLVEGDRVEVAVLDEPHEREVELVRLHRAFPGITIVQRLTDGQVRVLGPDVILNWDGAHWWTKPYAESYLAGVGASVPGCSQMILRAILEFCVHTMSPSRAGAMLVWQLDRDDAEVADEPGEETHHLRGTEESVRLPRLSLLDAGTHGAVRQLLTQVDGATVVDADGNLRATGLHLAASVDAQRLVAVPRGRGTRHTAAQRFSFDEERTVVFVVSADGPVSVFSDGARIAAIDALDGEPAGTEAGSQFDGAVQTTCSRCARRLSVRRAVGAIAIDDELPALDVEVAPVARITCPVCGTSATIVGAAEGAAARVVKRRS